MMRGVLGGTPVMVGPPKVQRFIFTSVRFSTNHMPPCSQWEIIEIRTLLQLSARA